jgi:hypothetical protein
VLTGLNWLELTTVADSDKYVNEITCFIKSWTFIVELNDYKLHVRRTLLQGIRSMDLGTDTLRLKIIEIQLSNFSDNTKPKHPQNQNWKIKMLGECL